MYDVNAYRELYPPPDKKWRKLEIENKVSEVINDISKDYNVPPPEVIVVPSNYILQVSDGETDIATYKPAIQRIYISPDMTLFDLCHEMGHHIENVKREKAGKHEKGMEEWRRSQEIPWEERQSEKRAETFALHCTVKYKDEWAKLFGDKRFMPWQRDKVIK